MVEDATPRELWRRLLAGQVTEVYVLSHGGLYRDLPQTLGLEVITPEPYVYGRYGVLRTPAERAEIARALAAERRWLAIGGLPFWAEPFARRAEVILIFPGALPDFFSGWSLSGELRSMRRRFAPVDARELADESSAAVRLVYGFDRMLTNDELRAYFIVMREFLLGAFPGKTFVVGGVVGGRGGRGDSDGDGYGDADRDGLAKLRAVRARGTS